MAEPWVKENIVDSRAALDEYTIENFKNTVKIEKQAPGPLRKREKEFTVSYEDELKLQQDHGHKVKIHVPHRQMYNKPSLPFHNPNSIYPPDMNPAVYLDRPKPTIASTFDDDLEVHDRRQWKYDGIQVDSITPRTRGDVVMGQVRGPSIPLHMDAVDSARIYNPEQFGGNIYRQQEYDRSDATLRPLDNVRDMSHVPGLRMEDREFENGDQNTDDFNTVESRTVPWIRAGSLEERGYLNARNNGNQNRYQTDNFASSTIRGTGLTNRDYLQDMNRLDLQADQLVNPELRGTAMGTEREFLEASSLGTRVSYNNASAPAQRSLKLRERTMDKHDTGHTQQTWDRRDVPVERHMVIRDRKFEEQLSNQQAPDFQSGSAPQPTHRGTAFAERVFQHNDTATNQDYTRTATENERGITYRELDFEDQQPNHSFDVQNRRLGTRLGFGIKDREFRESSNVVDRDVQASAAQQQRGLTRKDVELETSSNGNMSFDLRMTEAEILGMKDQYPRLSQRADAPQLSPNDKPLPKIEREPTKQLQRRKEQAENPIYDDYENDMAQVQKVRTRENKNTENAPNHNRVVLGFQEPKTEMKLGHRTSDTPKYHRRSERITPMSTPDWRPRPMTDNRDEVAFSQKYMNLPKPF